MRYWNNESKCTSGTSKWLHYLMSAIFVFAGCCVAVVGILSLLKTYVFPMSSLAEVPSNSLKYVLVSSAVLVVVVFLLYRLRSYISSILEPIDLKIFYLVMIAIIAIFGLLWVLLIATYPPAADQDVCLGIAETLFSSGSADELLEGYRDYFVRFPYQSGLIIYWMLIMKLFGMQGAYYVFRIINIAFSVVCALCLSRLCRLFSGSVKAEKICIILLILFFPLMLFANFAYGNLPSVAFSLLAILMQQLTFCDDCNKKKQILLCTGSILCILVAIWLKTNSLIFFIAIEIIWFICFIIRKKIQYIAVAIASLIIVFMASNLPSAYLSEKYDLTIDEGIPSIAWIAMGMQESSMAEGWYNNYIVEIHEDNNGNSDDIQMASIEYIKDRLGFFSSNPLNCIHFFGRKIATEWCEPTFQTIWLSFYPAAIHQEHLLPTQISDSCRNGKILRLGILESDIFQSLIYVCSLLCFVKLRKKPTLPSLILAIVFLGGFICHIFWEAKAIYTLPYFLCLIPYAAMGVESVLSSSIKDFFLIKKD